MVSEIVTADLPPLPSQNPSDCDYLLKTPDERSAMVPRGYEFWVVLQYHKRFESNALF